MEFHIDMFGARADIAAIREAIQAEDPSALVDIDQAGNVLRVAASLDATELVLLVNQGGLPIGEHQVTQIPSVCCGGCGG